MTTNRKKRRLTKTTASTPPTSTSKNFTNQTDELAFKQRHYDLNTTRVYHLRPPKSLSSTARPWIATRETTADYNFIFRHPLTSKPHSFNLPPDFYFPQLNSAILAVFYAFRKSNSVDKLLVLPAPCYDSVSKCNLFVLYGGGQLKGRHGTSPWVKLSHRNSPWVKFDDIIDLKDKTYVVDRWGIINLVNHYKTVNTISIGKTLISEPVIPGSGQFGWRKRFAVDGEVLFLVVRMEEKLFKVFRLKSEKRGGTTCFNWVRVWEFGGNKVLFMARDCYFFRRASRKFPGREYRNCIVFSEAAFPQYGKDGWEFIESGNVRRCEDDIAVFCLGDERFAREGEEEGEGEKSGFPKIDWSPPDWILNVSSFTEDEFSMHSESESSVQSERVPDEDEGPDSDSGEKNDGEVQSGVMDSKTKDDEEQEVMEYDFVSQDQDQGGVECDSDSQDQEDEKMQCDLNSQEKDNEEMHSKEANAEHDNVSLQEDPVTPSRSAVEEEVTRTLLRMNSENDAMEEETSGKNITYVIPQASTSATTERHKCDSATTKFEGLHIRSDLVPTLQKIWRKHGNVTTDSIVRSSDIIARALESLATMVQILEDNLAQSLSDSQADYLSSTLSDLKCLQFKVYWLVSFVENALKVHKSKSLVESLNNLSQLSSQVEERRAILLDEVAKLNEEETKLKEEMTKVSKTIPFSGLVNFDEPLGVGLI